MQTFLDKFITKKSKSKNKKRNQINLKNLELVKNYVLGTLKKDKCNSREGCAFDENKGSKGQKLEKKLKLEMKFRN